MGGIQTPQMGEIINLKNLIIFSLGFLFCLIVFFSSFYLLKHFYDYNNYISSYPNHDLNISHVNETCGGDKYCKMVMVDDMVDKKVNYTPDTFIENHLVWDWNKSNWKADCEDVVAINLQELRKSNLKNTYWVEQYNDSKMVHTCYAIKINNNTLILENCDPEYEVRKVVRYR